MMKLSVLAASASLAFLPVTAFAADDVPDLTGKWVGKTYSIVAGAGGHWPTSAGTFEKPALLEKDLVLTINGQEGRRFWGVSTLSGGGESTDEAFIGQFTPDGEHIIVADTDGYYLDGRLDGDTFSFCYAHAGGPTKSSVISCTEVVRGP